MKSMKKLLACVLSVVILCASLSGCNSSESKKSTTSKTTQATTTSSVNEENNPPETPGVEDKFELLFNNGELVDLGFEIDAISELYDNKAVYSSALAEDGTIKFAVVDFKNGTYTSSEYKTEFETEEHFYQFAPTPYGAVFIDLVSAKFVTFDEKLNKVSEETVDDISYPNVITLGDKIYLNPYDSGNIIDITIKSDNTLECNNIKAPIEDSKNFTLSSAYLDGKMLATVYNEDYTVGRYELVDLGKSTSSPLNVAPENAVYIIDKGFVSVNDSSNEVVVYLEENKNLRKSFSYKAGLRLYSIDNDVAYFWSENYDFSNENKSNSVTLTAYSLKDGSYLGEYSHDIKDFGYFVFAKGFGDKIVLGLSIDDKISTIICTLEGKDDSENSCGGIFGNNLSYENAEIIERIKKDYGIKIYTKEDAVKFFYGYAVVSEKSDNYINNALVELEKFLKKLPGGMTQEMVNRAGYDGFDMYFTGKIHPDTSSDSINNASAFTSVMNNRHTIVVDVTMGGIEPTIAHEFMHAIDNSMSGILANSSDNLEYMYRWYKLNPEDFYYSYNYTDSDGNTLDGENFTHYLGTYYTEGDDVDNIYFTDGYATNFPNEDQARIFEYIAGLSPDSLPSYFKSKNLQLKASYLSACIRQAFECIDDDTTLFWEQCLDEKHDLSYFDKLFKSM